MDWADIWKIILCAVGSAGGVGAIIVCMVKFASDMIANRLSQKYEAKLQKDLEFHRAAVDGKIHITKTQYDAEFGIYRTLSKSFFEMVVVLHSAFSSDYRFAQRIAAKDAKIARDAFITVATKMQNAQDTLYENAAFIQKSLYKKYEEILQEAATVFWEYKEKVCSENMQEIVQYSDWLDEMHERVNKIQNMLINLNDDLRIYLQSLTIVE